MAAKRQARVTTGRIATLDLSLVLKDMQDNRDIARPGDLVAANWFDDPRWHIGIVEKGDDGGLGFPIGDLYWGDLEGAYHAVVLSRTIRF